MTYPYSFLLALCLAIILASRPGIVTTPSLPDILPGTIALHHPSTPTLADRSMRALPSLPIPTFTLSTHTVAFASTGVGYHREQTVFVTGRGGSRSTARVTITGDAGEFSVGASLLQLDGSTQTAITVRFTPTTPDSCSLAIIRIDDSTTVDTLLVTGCAVAAQLPFSGLSLIDFDAVAVGGSSSRADTLGTISGDSLAYNFSFLDGGNFLVTAPAGGTMVVTSGLRRDLVLTFRPTGSSPQLCIDTLLVRSDIGDRRIIARGAVIAKLDSIAIDRAELDFGDVRVGSSAQGSFTVFNTYLSDSLFVTQAFPQNPFDTSGSGTGRFIIAPHSSHDVLMRFTPPDTGMFTAIDTLYFDHINDTNKLAMSVVTLRGRGTRGILKASPDTVVIDSLRAEFCAPGSWGDSAVVDFSNVGNIPITITAELAQGGQGFSFQWQRLMIAPDGQHYPLTVRFCGTDSAAATDTMIIRDAESPLQEIKRVPLIHHAANQSAPADSARIRVDMDSIDFGDVDTSLTLGTMRTIYIHNTGSTNASIDIDTIVATPGGAISNTFRLLDPPRRLIQVPALDSISVTLLCRPTTLGPVSALWMIHMPGADSIIAVRLTGNGVLPPTRSRVVWFNNAHQHVGETIRLTMFGQNEPAPGSAFIWDSAIIHINPMALLLTGVEPSGLAVARDDNDSTIILRHPAGSAPPADSTIFTLLFTGLSTGEPVNHVVIDSVYGQTPAIVRADGIVLLDGCDVGRGLGGSLKPVIREIRIDPASASAALAYRAADGAIPTITMVSTNGTEVIRRALPPATGAEQSATLWLRDLPRGLYWLELRVESDRVTIPIMITR